MRTYKLTLVDLTLIDTIRSRAEIALNNEVYGFMPQDERKRARLVANNREMQAIIEHVRVDGISPYVSFELAVIGLALGRHGQPGINPLAVKPTMQPEFSELPTVG